MSEEDRQQKFVVQLTEHQNRVYGYIFSMLGDHTVAADVLQETNLVLWRRSSEWMPDAPFLPWAFTVARFQVLAHVRDRKRERCLLDTELVEAMSVDVAAEADRLEQTRDALRHCLTLLSQQNRDLIQQRYYLGTSIGAMAEALSRSVEAIKVSLLRIRRSLHACVVRQNDAVEGARR